MFHMQVISEAEILFENKKIFQGLFMMRSVSRTMYTNYTRSAAK